MAGKDCMIKLENVNKSFGDLHVLKDVNLKVKEGEKLVIIGPSSFRKINDYTLYEFSGTAHKRKRVDQRGRDDSEKQDPAASGKMYPWFFSNSIYIPI